MKNRVILNYDPQCPTLFTRSYPFRTYRGRCCRKDIYKYLVVYEDGFVSRIKEHGKKRKPWGIIYSDYILAINPAPYQMTPSEIKEYCKNNTFAGATYTVLPYKVLMTLVRRDLEVVNEQLSDLGGKPFKSAWYVSKNDKWLDVYYRYNPEFCGVHPVLTNARIANFITDQCKTVFYPAIPLTPSLNE